MVMKSWLTYSPLWVGFFQSVEGPNRTKKKKQGKGKFAVSAWARTLVFSYPQSYALLALKPSSSDQASHHQLPQQVQTRTTSLSFLGFHLSERRSWNFSASIVLQANSFMISLFLYVFLYLIWFAYCPHNPIKFTCGNPAPNGTMKWGLWNVNRPRRWCLHK